MNCFLRAAKIEYSALYIDRCAFFFIITIANANGTDMSPATFGVWMHYCGKNGSPRTKAWKTQSMTRSPCESSAESTWYTNRCPTPRRFLSFGTCSKPINATIIKAPSSAKNERQERDPEMHQTKKRGVRIFFRLFKQPNPNSADIPTDSSPRATS